MFQINLTLPSGEYDGAEDRFTLFGQRIIWQNGSPPADAIQEVIIRRYVDYSVFYIMCSLVAICIMLAIALLTVNIYFRNHKFIKMSSPNVNNLIILGSIMTYCSVILLGIDTNMVSELDYSRMCTVRIRKPKFGSSALDSHSHSAQCLPKRGGFIPSSTTSICTKRQSKITNCS
ncbi:gamma-aminobutyric acid type B receptor subunit 2 [Trichinella spiralis]|uniref:gamma-aminobutyric acid type B receptor subunit 2 n=1 Tax=Trichinella spiralis TaxID=6334 RepID=UPI0001EFDA4F|nr:gamma-aminobutyric acid type B receptor subunit 2 [Trichinella spiralis]